MIHIGEIIENELRSQKRTVSWLARNLSCDRSNCYSIFKRESIDSNLLQRICVILKRDFFEIYREYLEAGKKDM